MTKDLFFDTDCLSSFLWINDTNIIEELYGGKIILPQPVYSELSNPSIPHIKRKTDNLISRNIASIKNLEYGTEEYKLYSSLIKDEPNKRSIGRGEAAAIALTKVYNGIIVSNNHRDIDVYVKKYNLRQLDTGKILVEALEKNLITEEEGNTIWKKMLSKKRKLPNNSFSDYLKSIK